MLSLECFFESGTSFQKRLPPKDLKGHSKGEVRSVDVNHPFAPILSFCWRQKMESDKNSNAEQPEKETRDRALKALQYCNSNSKPTINHCFHTTPNFKRNLQRANKRNQHPTQNKHPSPLTHHNADKTQNPILLRSRRASHQLHNARPSPRPPPTLSPIPIPPPKTNPKIQKTQHQTPLLR